jgi:hypothetical protein
MKKGKRMRKRESTTWWPSGELSRPPLESRIYGSLVVGWMQFERRASMRWQTYIPTTIRISIFSLSFLPLDIDEFAISWGKLSSDEINEIVG